MPAAFATNAYSAVLRLLPAPGRPWLKAALAVPQIVPGIGRPLEWLTPCPARERVSFDLNGEAISADLYLPAITRRDKLPAVVMTLGANDLGGRDPRAISMAEGLARCGFLTLVVIGAPALAPEADSPLGLVEAPLVAAAAFDYVATRTDVDPRRIGLVGVCLGGSACLLTAARDDHARRVAFVFVIGPYLSLRSLLRAMVSGTTLSADGVPRAWSARPWVLGRAREWLLSLLEPDERACVRSALDSADYAPASLSPRAQTIFHLANGVASEEADHLIDSLGDAFVAELEAASPAGQLTGLRAETYVMHGVADGVVPIDESRRLVRQLRGQVPIHYAEFELFEHADATRRLGADIFARELWRLVQHIRLLLRYAD
jgi:pimeloyl-ACP methyl ester carboxylesterase